MTEEVIGIRRQWSRLIISMSAKVEGNEAPPLEFVAIVFDSQGQVNQTLSLAKTTSNDQSIRLRRRPTRDHGQEFLIDLHLMNANSECIALAVRTNDVKQHRWGTQLSKFGVSCFAVKHLMMGDYGDNVLHHLQQSTYCPSSSFEKTKPGTDEEESHTETRDHNSATANTVFVGVVCRKSCKNQFYSTWELHWRWSSKTLASLSLTSLTNAMVDEMKMFLVRLFPDSLTSAETFTTIESICSALRMDEFPLLEACFPEEGLEIEEFARTLLKMLMLTRPVLRQEDKAIEIVALLYDLFEQIDINEDLHVDWDEFTSFCVLVGMLATDQKQDKQQTVLIHERYVQQPLELKFDFDTPIKNIKYFAALKRIAIMESTCYKVPIYDLDGTFLHTFFPFDKEMDITPAQLTDIEHVASNNTFATASSSHHVSIWTIMNSRSGTYSLAYRMATRDMQTKLRYSYMTDTLYSFSADSVLLRWDLEEERSYIQSPEAHSDYITDLVDMPDQDMYATCSLDRRINCWNLKGQIQFVLRGHVQGILHLDYAQNVIISSGFENTVYCWYLPLTKPSAVLTGHNASSIGVKMLVADPLCLRAITGDKTGRFKIWDLSRVSRQVDSIAVLLQTFRYYSSVHISSALSLAEFQILPTFCSASFSSCFNDLIVAEEPVGFAKFQVLPDKIEVETPRHVVYNSVVRTFTGSIKKYIRLWDGGIGKKQRDLVEFDKPADISAILYAQPKQRKLFVAFESGMIRIYNPVNGHVMMEEKNLHKGYVWMKYCQYSKCLITTGKDQSLCVSHDVQGQNDLQFLRRLDRAHSATITSLAYSGEYGWIATGDAYGQIRVWDFQTLSLLVQWSAIEAEIVSVEFGFPYPFLIALDSNGLITVHYIRKETEKETLSTTFMTSTPPEASKEDRYLATRIFVLSPQDLPSPERSPPSKKSNDQPSIHALCFLYNPPELVTQLLDDHDDDDHPGLPHEPAVFYIVAGDEVGFLTCWAFTAEMLAPYQSLPKEDYVSASSSYKPYKRGIATFLDRQPGRIGREEIDEKCIPYQSQWKAHDRAITSVKADTSSGYLCLYTVGDDITIRVWDLISKHCLGILDGDEIYRTNNNITQQQKNAIRWSFGDRLPSKPVEKHKQIALEVLTGTHRNPPAPLQEDEQDKREDSPLQNASKASMHMEIHPITQQQHTRFFQMEQLLAKEAPPPTADQVSQSRRNVAKKLKHMEAQALLKKSFSTHSINTGSTEGFFTSEDVRTLKNLDLGLRATYSGRPVSPVIKSPQVLLANSKSAGDLETQSRLMRNCKHYHVEKHKSSKRRGKVALTRDSVRELASPSKFLQKHLREAPGLPPIPIKIKARASAKIHKKTINVSTGQEKVLRSALLELGSATPLPLLAPIAAPEASRETIQEQINRKIRLASDIYDECTESKSANVSPIRLPKVEKRTKEKAKKALIANPNIPDLSSKVDPKLLDPSKNPYGPYYQVQDVLSFANVLAVYDADGSGDIDREEWRGIIHSIRGNSSKVEKLRMDQLFLSIDKNDDGSISAWELMQIMFSRATKQQLVHMRNFIQQLR